MRRRPRSRRTTEPFFRSGPARWFVWYGREALERGDHISDVFDRIAAALDLVPLKLKDLPQRPANRSGPPSVINRGYDLRVMTLSDLLLSRREAIAALASPAALPLMSA